MGEILGFFSDIFGYILNAIYNLEFIRNYGVAIILFTIIVKVILLPISIKQQKTMKKSAKIQEETKKIQEKYKNDQEKMNQEMIAVYKREKMSPCSGCISGLVQILLILSVFYLVSQPLTHMRKVDNELINTYKEEVKQEAKGNITYPEINVIRQKGNLDERVYINMNFLGLDLSDVPSGALNNIKVYIIPILYVITSVISIKISTNTQNKKKAITNEEENKKVEQKNEKTDEIDFTTQMNKNMTFMMPFMAVMVAMVAPLGLALYWLTNNILTIFERMFINKMIEGKEEE